MSTLTKVLVILVVVLALLQTAATVVFVSRAENAQATVSQLRDQNAANEAAMTQMRTSLADASTQVATVRTQAQAQVADIQRAQNQLQQQLADAGVRAAQLQSQLALQSTDLARATEALKASEETKSKFADQMAELRKFNDDFTRRVADLNAANADLTNRLEVTERERRNLAEQLTEAQTAAGRMQGAMRDANVAMPSPGTPTGVGRGAPAINAQVKEVGNIPNMPWATISVGSADRVTKGMQFTIIDGQGNLLGFMTVETVEPNQAAGKLTGPRVTDIRAGAAARTQM